MTVSKNVCADLLKHDLENGIKNSRQLYATFERLVACFLAVAEEQAKQSEEIYGNGTPGGLKLDIHDMKAGQDSLKKDVKEIADRLAQYQVIDRREKEKPSSFEIAVKWFADKVLPALVISFIVFIANLVMFVSAFMFMVGNGIISLQ